MKDGFETVLDIIIIVFCIMLGVVALYALNELANYLLK